MVCLIGEMGEGLIVEFIKFYTSLICQYRGLGTVDSLLNLFPVEYQDFRGDWAQGDDLHDLFPVDY